MNALYAVGVTAQRRAEMNQNFLGIAIQPMANVWCGSRTGRDLVDIQQNWVPMTEFPTPVNVAVYVSSSDWPASKQMFMYAADNPVLISSPPAIWHPGIPLQMSFFGTPYWSGMTSASLNTAPGPAPLKGRSRQCWFSCSSRLAAWSASRHGRNETCP